MNFVIEHVAIPQGDGSKLVVFVLMHKMEDIEQDLLVDFIERVSHLDIGVSFEVEDQNLHGVDLKRVDVKQIVLEIHHDGLFGVRSDFFKLFDIVPEIDEGCVVIL